MKKRYGRYIIALLIGLLALAAGILAYRQYRERIFQEQQAAEEKAREEQIAAEEERRRKREEELTAEASEIAGRLEKVDTDAIVCEEFDRALKGAKRAKKEIQSYRKTHGHEDAALLKKGLEILEEAGESADEILKMQSIDEALSEIYDDKTGSVSMSTSKNERIFQDVQQKIWEISEEKYPGRLKAYEKAVAQISDAWNYTNDAWNYETSTLRVSVKPQETSYTKYWVCHIRTFSTQQLRSALCGGTYGNPRVTTSRELAAHKGVIGVNGSGFSYGSGIPAEGKSMIKEGKVYNDIYSNGNIFCVTADGGMFTAIAGMTTEEMINRGVCDTYCFGPTLVEGGKACRITSAFQQTYRYQRTAVGMVSPGDYYLVVVDGKGAGGSQGMTYEELQDVFLKLDCEYAYNLDGGGSSTLVFRGRVINTLTDGGGERPCGDILYFIDAGDGGEGEDIVVHEGEAMLRPPSGS